MGDLFDWIGDLFESIWDAIEDIVDTIWDFINDIVNEIMRVFDDIYAWLQETLGPLMLILEIVLFFTGAPIVLKAINAIEMFKQRVTNVTAGFEEFLLTEIVHVYAAIAYVEAGVYEWVGTAMASVYKDMMRVNDEIIAAVEKRSEALAKRLEEETEEIMLVMDREVDRVDHEIHVVAYKVEDVGHFGEMMAKTLEV